MSLESTPKSQFYAISAPTSPGRCKPDNVFFYSEPTSPIRIILEPEYNPEIEPTWFEKTNSNNPDEFEFETSHRFAIGDYDDLTSAQKADDEMEQEEHRYCHRNSREHRASLPVMAFADELFCDGKVMPLKPPPGQQSGSQSSTTPSPSPRSPSSILRLPFRRRSLWNNEFDPFLAALDNVIRDENNNEKPQRNKHRRAKSMSPLRGGCYRCTNNACEDQVSYPSTKGVITNLKPKFEREAYENPIIPMKLAEPKGVVFARRARLVKMKEEWPREPVVTCGFQHLLVEIRKREDKRGGPKRKRMKSFLFRSKSTVKPTDYEQKPVDQNVQQHSRSKILRRLSLKHTKVVRHNTDKMVSDEVIQVPITQFRPPKFLLCMGFGAKYES